MPDNAHSLYRPLRVIVFIAYWTFVLLGTTVSGCLFGAGLVLLDSGFSGDEWLVGGVIGWVFAGFAGIPIHITAAVLAWTCKAPWLRIPFAVAAGLLTAQFALNSLGDPQWDLSLWANALSFSAMLTGGAGAGLGALLGERFYRRLDHAQDKTDPWWRFTISEVLLRTAVLALLVVGWKMLAANEFANLGGQ